MTTDMLMEGVHFDLTYIDMVHLGYKSAMVNISDIFATVSYTHLGYIHGSHSFAWWQSLLHSMGVTCLQRHRYCCEIGRAHV